MLPASVNDVQVLLGRGAERWIAQHKLGVAEDGVHGSTNLMRHVGQERALRPPRRFRSFLGLLEISLGAFLVAEIREGFDQICPALADQRHARS